MKVLITAVPMLRRIDFFRPRFTAKGITLECPQLSQSLSEAQLLELVPQCDGWIVGNDPATRKVFQAGKAGKLKAAVRWGVGVDNVDVAAAKETGVAFANTPDVFGADVADLAVGYVIALARQTFLIDREVRKLGWPKPVGVSVAGKTVALVGFGDIGRHIARRLLACETRIVVYDPVYRAIPGLEGTEHARWPDRLGEADFIVLACALTPETRHLINAQTLQLCKKGVRIVNVARGPLVDEPALADALRDGCIHSAALDVFEIEPLPAESPLRACDNCLFGSHNASNTAESVERASAKAIDVLFGFLKIA